MQARTNNESIKNCKFRVCFSEWSKNKREVSKVMKNSEKCFNEQKNVVMFRNQEGVVM